MTDSDCIPGSTDRSAGPLRKRRGLYADCLRTYLGEVSAAPDDRSLDRLILRSRSRRALELLALHATHGRMRLADLVRHIDGRGSSMRSLEERVGGAVDPAVLVRISRVLALLEEDPGDRACARKVMDWVFRRAGWPAFRPDHARLFQNLAFEGGDFELARELASAPSLARLDRLILQADLLNPFGPSPFSSFQGWQGPFSRLFGRDGLEAPTVVVPPGSEPFDGLQCPARELVTEGPIVSVIITSWHPGQGLETAVRSILAQSWRNLEILVVDDASPTEYRSVLERVAAMDPRICLVRLAENRGTYNARNEGLKRARGEFVTGQDSDDWSHPRRIEKQVRALIRNRRLVSTTSHALRCDATLVFNAPGTQARRENASSLMFRREVVLDRAGFYDTTRKGGDTEFMLRIRRLFGERSHRVLEPVLALIRQSRNSLSTAEFRPGWRHPARAAYRRSYEFWHSTSDDQLLLLGPDSERSRSFPIPARFRTVSARKEGGEEVDLVFADDLRGEHNPLRLRALLDEVNCALRAGRSVGLLHLRSFSGLGGGAIDTFWSPLAKLLHSGRVRELLTTDILRPHTLIVRDPEVVMFLAPEGVRLRPREIIVAVERPVRDSDGSVWFVPEVCERSIREAFGRSPLWRASSGLAPDLRTSLPPGARTGRSFPLIIDTPGWKAPRRHIVGRRPVVGRISEDLPTDFPRERELLLQLYPPSGKLPVRFLGGEKRILEVLGDRSVPRNWALIPCGTMNPDVFLSGCDFVVHFDRGGRKASTTRLIVQALAAGCVVLAPPALAAKFGDAVVGVSPSEVADVILDLAASPDRFRERVDRGLRFAQRADGTDLFGRTEDTAIAAGRNTGAQRQARETASPSPVLRHYLRQVQGRSRSRALDSTLIRMGSDNGRELLLAQMTGRAFPMAELARHLEGLRSLHPDSEGMKWFAQLNPNAAVRLARLLLLQELHASDAILGRDLVRVMVALHGPGVLASKWTKIFFDSAMLAGDITFASYLFRHCQMDARARPLAQTDLLHPRWGGDSAAWLEKFNSPFIAAGLEPVALEHHPGHDVQFDAIRMEPSATVPEGPLVSVIITAWRPSRALVSSVRSVLRQSWLNLEVLVVDDGSPADFDEVLDECERMDPRLRILRLDRNQGTYVARNIGMAAAKGEFITFQDSDDLSHPRRLELQLAPFENHPEVVATRSSALGVDEHLLLAAPGREIIHGNASSLMIRRSVLETVGFFDIVRKGADTEFSRRIEATFGTSAIEVHAGVPLAIIRRTSGSLSRLEFKPGWRHPARTAYREAYTLWHERVSKGQESAFLPQDGTPRRFPAPRRFAVNPPGEGERFDVVFVADLRPSADEGSPTPGEEIALLRAAGLRVGWCQVESIRGLVAKRQAVRPALREALVGSGVEELVHSDRVRAKLVVCIDPVILQFTQATPFSWSVDKLVVLTAAGPAAETPSFSVEDCGRNARYLFGLDPLWAPRTPAAKSSLGQLVDPASLLPFEIPLVVGGISAPVMRKRQNRATIGCWCNDATGERLGEVLRKVPEVLGIALRIAVPGPAETIVTSRTARCLEMVAVEDFPSGSAQFIASLDYYVRLDRADVALFPVDVLGALAHGCVVILHPSYRPHLQDAALYCTEQELSDLVKRIDSDPELHGFVREKLTSAAARLFDPSRFVATMERIISMVDPGRRGDS